MTDVVAALADLRTSLAWPGPDAADDLTGAVLGRLGPRRRRRPRWTLVAVAGVAAVGAGVPVAAHYLSMGGVRIELTGEVPSSIGGELDLGSPTALREDAPRPPALGDPAAAFEGAPRRGYTEVWPGPVLVMSFPGTVTTDLIEKRVFGAGRVETTNVDGADAFWVEGYHGFLYLDADGAFREETLRLAGSALIWTRDGITYRIEGASLTRAEAVELAESMF